MNYKDVIEMIKVPKSYTEALLGGKEFHYMEKMWKKTRMSFVD